MMSLIISHDFLLALRRALGRPIVLFLLGALCWQNAAAQTLTFESFTAGDQRAATLSSGGFLLEEFGPGGPDDFFIYGPGNGYASNVLHNKNAGRGVRLRKSDNSAFDLASLDVAGNVYGGTGYALVTGFTAANSLLTQNIGGSSAKTLVTQTLNWKSVVKVEIVWASGSYGALDNFVLGAAPTGPTTGLVSGGIYRLSPKSAPTKCLDVRGGSQEDNDASGRANVQQWSYWGGLNQQWKVVSTNDGYYKLVSANTRPDGREEVLDVNACLVGNGTNVQQYRWLDNICQRWKFTLLPDGTYKLSPKTAIDQGRDQVLDITGCSTEDNTSGQANAQLYQWLDSPCQHWSLTLISGPAPPSGGGGSTPAGTLASLGMNLAQVTDYASEQPFKDLVKTARLWNNGDPSGLQLDANGWVTSLGSKSEAYLVWDNPYLPKGEYVLLWDGDGEVNLNFGGTLTSSAPGRKVYNVTGDVLRITITRTSAANYVRNIRLLETKYESTYQTDKWNPDFVAHWQKFSVLRFMDWQRTNFQQVRSWADRRTPTWFTQAENQELPGDNRGGVCVEYLVELANKLHRNPWFCMPHRASDDYITQFATYVKNNLDPGLTPYIEYSNEVWNSSFGSANQDAQGNYTLLTERGQHTYAILQGRQESAWAGDPDWVKAGRWQGRRARQVMQLWETAFGGTSRLHRVMAWQLGAGSSWQQYVLGQDNAYEKMDHYAIGYYFGYDLGNGTAVSDVNDVFSKMPAALDQSKAEAAKDVAGLQGNASWRRLTLLAYEGGPHLVAGYTTRTASLTATLTAASRDQRMYQACVTHLNNWKALGGGLFGAYSSMGQYTQDGSWGVIELPSSPLNTQYKYQALLDWGSSNSAARLGSASAAAPAPPAPAALAEVFPNPAHGQFALRLPASDHPTRLSLRDGQGHEVRGQLLPAGAAQAQLDVRGLPQGLYLLRVQQAGQHYTQKVVLYP